jgi:hypothetical protein
MGTVPETAGVDYPLSFADLGKQTSVFPFLFSANKQKFAISVFHLRQTNRSCCFPLIMFSWKQISGIPRKLEFFSELVLTSLEIYGIPCAKFHGIQG